MLENNLNLDCRPFFTKSMDSGIISEYSFNIWKKKLFKGNVKLIDKVMNNLNTKNRRKSLSLGKNEKAIITDKFNKHKFLKEFYKI